MCKAVLCVFKAGAVIIRQFILLVSVRILAGQNITLVGRHGGGNHFVDQVHIRIVQIEVIARGRNLELAVEGLGGVQLIGLIREHKHIAARFEHVGRKRKRNPISPVGQHHAFQIQVVSRAVIQLQPVAEIAVLIRYRRRVRRHDLVDD